MAGSPHFTGNWNRSPAHRVTDAKDTPLGEGRLFTMKRNRRPPPFLWPESRYQRANSDFPDCVTVRRASPMIALFEADNRFTVHGRPALVHMMASQKPRSRTGYKLMKTQQSDS